MKKYWPDGTLLDDPRKLEVIENDTGFEFEIGSIRVNVYMHDPPIEGWMEERDAGSTYLRYYPEFSIAVYDSY